jgi:NAD(P)-dependent dehydrogenase (short-subunit alcohol dehydrogenase family)
MTKIKQAGMVRFFAPLIVAKHAPKYLNPGPASSVTLTTGSVSERPRPDWSIIGSFATGLHGMNRSLALDLAPIRVNLISPGGVETELWNGIPEDKRKEMFKQMSESVPLKTIGKPEDVAESYIYCMRDENLTGSVISTNSGALLLG